MANSKLDLNIENVSSFIKNIKKKISKRCIILEFSDQNLKLVEAKLIKNNISFRAFRNIKLPIDALNKGVPSDPEKMSKLILDLMNEENINTKSAAVVLNSESIFIKNVYTPNNLTKSQAIKYLINSSNQQLPIPISQLDFDLIDSFEKKSNKTKKKFLLIAIPKKLTNVIADTLNRADLDLKLLDFNCISNTRLVYKEQKNLKEKEYILLLDFKNDATLLTLLDKNSPLLIERISAIREYPHDFDVGISNAKDYLELSKMDFKIIFKDIKKILRNYFETEPDFENYQVFIMGPNSAHPKLVELLGELLNKSVFLLSPTNCEGIYDAKYNDETNEFFISSLIGTGLGLSFSLNIDSEKINDFKYIRKFIPAESVIRNLNNIEKKNDNSKKKNDSEKIKNDNNKLENKEINLKNNSKEKVINKNNKESPIKDIDNKSKKSPPNKEEFKFDNKFLE